LGEQRNDDWEVLRSKCKNIVSRVAHCSVHAFEVIEICGVSSKGRRVHVCVQVCAAITGTGNEASNMTHVARDKRICEQAPKSSIRRILMVKFKNRSSVRAEKSTRG
jgi:hypothetical protein